MRGRKRQKKKRGSKEQKGREDSAQSRKNENNSSTEGDLERGKLKQLQVMNSKESSKK